MPDPAPSGRHSATGAFSRVLTTARRARTLLLDKMTEPRARRRVVVAPPRKPPAELRGVRVIVEDDPDPDVSYLMQEGFEERRRAHKRGELGFVGVHVEATVFIEDTEQTLVSPGLWGIENDLDEEELDQIVGEEWNALRNVLKTVGVTTEQLPLEVDREWIEWRI